MQLIARTDVAWCEIDGIAIFLDITADRYFRLPEAENRRFLHILEREGLEFTRQPEPFILPSQLPRPARSALAIASGGFELSQVARALWTQRRIERRLASHSLHSILTNFKTLVQTRANTATVDSPQARSTVRAFEFARLLRTAANRCLPRSLALGSCLAMDGVLSHIVIGVKLAPFGAHCWVQVGDEVLNDSVEEVLRYRPILIL